MTHPIIETTTPDDIPALQQVVDATGLFPGEMLPDMIAPAFAGDTAALWLTAHVESRAVGLCYTVPEELAEGTWNMLALAVHPDLQGKGIGAALVTAAEERLTNEGQRILIVETSGTDGFQATRGFYARMGYGAEARIRDFWADGDDKVIFRKAF